MSPGRRDRHTMFHSHDEITKGNDESTPMKKLFTLAVCSIMMVVAVHAQNLINKPFDYPALSLLWMVFA